MPFQLRSRKVRDKTVEKKVTRGGRQATAAALRGDTPVSLASQSPRVLTKNFAKFAQDLSCEGLRVGRSERGCGKRPAAKTGVQRVSRSSSLPKNWEVSPVFETSAEKVPVIPISLDSPVSKQTSSVQGEVKLESKTSQIDLTPLLQLLQQFSTTLTDTCATMTGPILTTLQLILDRQDASAAEVVQSNHTMHATLQNFGGDVGDAVRENTAQIADLMTRFQDLKKSVPTESKPPEESMPKKVAPVFPAPLASRRNFGKNRSSGGGGGGSSGGSSSDDARSPSRDRKSVPKSMRKRSTERRGGKRCWPDPVKFTGTNFDLFRVVFENERNHFGWSDSESKHHFLRRLAKEATQFATYVHNIDEMSWPEMWRLVGSWYGFDHSQHRYQELFRTQKREPGWSYGRFAALLVSWGRRGYPTRSIQQIETKVFDALVHYSKLHDPAIYERYALTLTSSAPISNVQDFVRVADAWLAAYPEAQFEKSLRPTYLPGAEHVSGSTFSNPLSRRQRRRNARWNRAGESEAEVAVVQASTTTPNRLQGASRTAPGNSTTSTQNSTGPQISNSNRPQVNSGRMQWSNSNRPTYAEQLQSKVPTSGQSSTPNVRQEDIPPPYPCPRCRVGMHWAKHCPVFPGFRRPAPYNEVQMREVSAPGTGSPNVGSPQLQQRAQGGVSGVQQPRHPHGNERPNGR
jgi:hypothetical protein